MVIKGCNSPVLTFLEELYLQCSLAQQAFEDLRVASRGWLRDADADGPGPGGSPLRILNAATVFLSASGIISKILFPGRRSLEKYPHVHTRCQSLRELMGITHLPILENLGVRNDYEHVDERMDLHMRKTPLVAVSWLSVSEDGPSAGSLALKRIDPRRLTLACASNVLSLEQCLVEVQTVKAQIAAAFKVLHDREVQLWPA